MEFFIKYFRYHYHVISCIVNDYITSGLKWINVTFETMEHYLSNDTRLAPFESVSKNMLVYLNVELPACLPIIWYVFFIPNLLEDLA